MSENVGESGYFSYTCDNEVHVKAPEEVTETRQGRVWEAFTECPDCGQYVRACSTETSAQEQADEEAIPPEEEV